jgi:hypothetical protein
MILLPAFKETEIHQNLKILQTTVLIAVTDTNYPRQLIVSCG